ncbi:uncharacterized protein LOC110247927 [Paramuricea clavata]|jgi:hypothetical protein|uniref:Uncharacterized protein LOC110247927 n=1 Tax=Paramuricea clavata TaxID=317549 RepID=A0A7D9L2G0_PARCT|nr:uncharacterized protein LOC110247927 [Paramuricea clavata]
MIRWRFVVHGGIDGFSRAVVYLGCACDNRSQTVFQLFLNSMSTYKCPRRIRSDHGTENVGVARWMLQHFGPASKPILTGLSVHNQRIERLWRDVNTYVISYFRNLFFYLESLDLLDPLIEVHLFALHYVFKPRINRALTLFATQWNNHPLSTEGNRSPYQVWVQGFYEFANSNYETVRDVVNPETLDVDSYGIDDDGPMPEIRTVNHVEIPESNIVLEDEEMAILVLLVNPLDEDNEHGKHLFVNACEALEMILDARLNNIL